MSRWHNEEKKQLGIAYLFLSAENRITDADFALFEEMGKSIKGFPEMKGEIIGECEKILSPPDNGKSRFEIVSEEFSSQKSSGFPSFFGLGSADRRNRAILWTLTSLLYQVTEKTDKKQKLVELWAEKSDIDMAIFIEMCDICKTQYAVFEYQKWLETIKGMSYQEVNSIMQESNTSLKSLEESVRFLITLGQGHALSDRPGFF